MTNPASDEQATLWYCETCSISGVLLTEPHSDVYSVVNGLRAAHDGNQHNCGNGIAYVRILRPTHWYGDFMAEQTRK